MRSRFTFFIIAALIIIPLTILGCKTQDTTRLEERIVELEGKLTEEETEVVEDIIPEVGEEKIEEEAEEEDSIDEEEVAKEEVEEGVDEKHEEEASEHENVTLNNKQFSSFIICLSAS